MGAPNRREVLRLTDPTQRLAFLCGYLTVKVINITPEEWLKTIMYMISELKPQLKYVSGFYTIGDLLRLGKTDNFENITDPKTVVFQKGLDQRVRCKRLYLLLHTEVPDKKRVSYRTLLLSQDGDLISWYQEVIRITSSGKTTVTRSIRTEFEKMSEDDLLRYLMGERAGVGEGVVREIANMLYRSTLERRERLISTEEARALAVSIADRTDVSISRLEDE